MGTTAIKRKFTGKKYLDFQPELKIPKSLPGLPAPVLMSKSDLNELKSSGLFSSNEKLTGRDDINWKKKRDRPTGKGFCAAVIDTGVSNHNDLKGAIVLPRLACNASKNKKDVFDFHGHGTHVAGLIAGRGDSLAGRGIAPGAKILSIKVTNKDSGDGSWWNVWNALMEVYKLVEEQQKSKTTIKDRISVVNLSFNGLDNLSKDAKFGYHKIYKLIDGLHKFNVPVVVSGGNNFHKFLSYGLAYPACNKQVIGVGSVSNFPIKDLKIGAIAPFSQRIKLRKQAGNYKEDSPCFLLAPGILSASLDCSDKNGYTYMTGSSQAAPVITGTILLLQERACKDKKYKRALPPVSLIKECLMRGSDTVVNSASVSLLKGKDSKKYFDGETYLRVNVPKAVIYLNYKIITAKL